MNIAFLKTAGASTLVASILFALSSGLAVDVRAADAASSTPPTGDGQAERPADLTLQLPIKAGTEESVQFEATVPGFTVVSAKLHFHSGTARTRLMLGVRFASRSVGAVRLEVALLDGRSQGAKTIHHFAHVEELGPEQARRKGHNLDLVRNWDAARALWFDVPIESRSAQTLRVEVYLQRDASAGDP